MSKRKKVGEECPKEKRSERNVEYAQKIKQLIFKYSHVHLVFVFFSCLVRVQFLSVIHVDDRSLPERSVVPPTMNGVLLIWF